MYLLTILINQILYYHQWILKKTTAAAASTTAEKFLRNTKWGGGSEFCIVAVRDNEEDEGNMKSYAM